MAAELRELGLSAGLDAFGITTATPFTETRRHLEDRRAAGLHGGMAFTYRNPARSTEPDRIVPGARAIVVGGRRYPSRRPAGSPAVPGAGSRSGSVAAPLSGPAPEPPADPAADPTGDPTAGPQGGPRAGSAVDPGRPVGVVARYASADHYAPLRRALSVVAERLRDDGWQARVVADDNALVDREAARRAGIGWYGKNTNLLLSGQGSWFVLGSVVTDAPLPAAVHMEADGCGACRRCLPGCPTGALVAPGVLDARKCLAWLLQAPGVFPVEYRAALGARMYGCDDCQEVCPENAAAARGDPDGQRAPGADDQPTVDLLEVLGATDDQLLAWLGRWYIPRRQARYLRRNALVVLGNTGDGRHADTEKALRRALADPDAIVRGHAVWAAARLDRRDLLASVTGDKDPDVRRELDLAGADLT